MENLLIERAVELWCREISNPGWDNGDNSQLGAVSSMLGSMSISAAKQESNNLNENIEVFRAELIRNLKELRDSGKGGYFWKCLTTDYGPDKNMADAADKAGISHKLFSIKSNVYIQNGFVSSSFGYSSTDVNHYPLENGDWLITSLQGADMNKVKESILCGNPLDLTIETSKGSVKH